MRHEHRGDGEHRERTKAMRRGLRLFGRSAGALPALLFVSATLALGYGLRLTALRPFAARTARALAEGQREVLEAEFGTPVPGGGEGAPVPRLRDPAVLRDLRWLACAPFLGLLALVPGALVAYGELGLVLPLLGGHLPGPRHGGVSQVVFAVVAVAGFGVAPGVVEAYRRWSTALLAPPKNARLEQRVRRLTETRADAVDAQAAELRRIERDLHDGIQARLVAMGLNLGAVEQLMEADPQAARTLLAQSREASATALRELRGLVRGIHPPVLAERGLADAIRALALDSPLTVEVVEDLPGRAEPPVESAVYFAVSELLTNAVRHAEAQRVWIDIHHTGDALRVQVTDDGRGGAAAPGEADGGSGLLGIERRLGTFDGVLALSSPRGGPTIVTLELPCVLSSPRTSTS